MSTNGDENKLDRQTDNQKTSKRALRGFVSVSEAAKFLGVSPDTLRNWEASGKLIPARTEGGARRYSPSVLVEYKKSLKPLPKTSVGLTSVSKAAEELQVSADTIRNWDKKGIIKSERTEGGLRRFTRSEIKRLQAELNINPSQNISDKSTPSYQQTDEFKKDIVLVTDKPILKNIQTLSADFTRYPGIEVSENPDVPTSRVLRVKPLTAFLSIFLVAFLGVTAIFATKHIDLNKNLPNYVKTDNSFTSPSSVHLGEVLAESTPSGSFIQINLDTQINGSLSGREASFSGELRAPNVLYTLTPGANVTITGDPQRPTISSSVSIGNASTTAKGIASFSSTNFSVTDGAVSLATGGVTNSNLSSSSITINTSGTLTGGGAVSLGGSITLTAANGGVTSIAGTANQVIASASTGDVTLSLPQDIDSSAAVEFSSAELSSVLLNGSTSGQLTLQTAAATTDYTFTLPSTGGTSGYVLTTDGSGTTSWISASGLVTTWDSIDNPVANQTLSMSTFTTNWNWATGTGASNLFNITSDASSNGTGSLVNIQTGTSSTLLPLRVRAGATEALTVDANGNVGVGTTGAGAKLHVNGGIISSSTLSSTTVSSLALSYETTYGRIMAVGADVFTNGLLRITSSRSDGSNETTFIAGDGNGNVGIGTTNPGARLEVGNGTDSFQVSSVGDVTFVDSNDGANITGPAGGALLITAPTNALNLQSDGSIDVNIAGGAGATGCTVNNTTGELNCAGSIIGGSSGVAGYWQRLSTTISPATSGDSVDVGNGGNFTAGLTTGKIGFGGTVSGSDYMTSITGDSTQDWSRLIDITQANNAAEDSAVISITNTANVGTVAGDTIDIKNFYTSLTPTATAQGTTVPAGIVNIYGTDSAISLTSTTLGNSSSRSAEIFTYGIKTNITGTPVINNTNADFDRAFYEVYGTNNTISLTPTLTAVTDVGATIYGSYNDIQLNSTGSSGLTSAVYGVFSQVTGDLTTTGNTTHYGGYFIVSGSADNSNGVYIGGVSGATNNYGLRIAGVASASTNYAIYSEAAAQSYFAGNVGIGITNPSRTLHVYRTGTQDSDNPTFQIEQGSTGDPLMQFIITGTQAWNIGVDNSDSDKFKIASAGTTGWGSTKMTIQTDGSVGIGTSAPTSTFSVISDNAYDNSGGFTLKSSTTDATTNMLFMSVSTSGDSASIQSYKNGTGAKYLFLNPSGGNVGIGTNNALLRQHIELTGGSGTINAIGDGLLIRSFNQANGIEIRHGSATGFLAINPDSAGSGALGLGTKGAFPLYFYTNAGLSAGTASTTGIAMTILNGGNVGIGTTAPTSIGSGGSPRVFNLHGTDATMATNLVLSTNTTTSGNGVGAIDFGTTGSAGEKRSASIISMLSGTSSSNAVGDLSFYTANGASGLVRKMVIQADGNVGVGDATPDALFDIDSTLTTAPSLGITQTGSFTGTGTNSVFSITSSATTGDVLTISNAGLTSGSIMTLTGPTGGSTGVTDHFAKITSDVNGNGVALMSLTSDFDNVGSAVTNYGLLVQTSDNTSVGNSTFGIRVIDTLTGNAAKTHYGVFTSVSSSSTTADTIYGGVFGATNTGAVTGKGIVGIHGSATTNSTSVNQTVYGSIFQPSTTGLLTGSTRHDVIGVFGQPLAQAASTAGIFSLKGVYSNPIASGFAPGTGNTTTAEVMGFYTTSTNQAASNCTTNCTVNTFGAYIDNATTSTNGTSTQYGLYINSQSGSDTNYQLYSAGSATSYFSGNVGIGTTAPQSSKVHILGGDDSFATNALHLSSASGANTEYGFLGTTAAGDYMRVGYYTGSGFGNVKFEGHVGIGTTNFTTPTLRVEGSTLINSNLYLTTISSAETATTICFSGKTVDGTSTNELRQCSSDARLKENISYFDQDNIDALAIINGLKPAHFDFINGSKNEVGFIAQDILQVIPETVGVNKSDGYYTFERSSVVPFLVKAVQELNFKVQNALLTLDPQGLASGNLDTDKITIASGIASGGLVSASDFALNASLLNKTGALASIPVSSDGKITVADSLNSLNSNVLGLESRILNQESKEASNSAQIAQASEVAQQAIAQAQSLDEKVASTSANLSSLSAQIQELLNSTADSTNSSSLPSAPDDGLTPPSELLTASSSATLANLKVTETISTANLESENATVSSNFKALGDSFLGRTTIAGDLSIDGAFSVTEGSKINALPTLYLQNNLLAEKIDLFNGKVTINKDGTIQTSTIIANQIKVNQNTSLGKGVIVSGQTEVTIQNALIEENSIVLITPEKPLNQTLAVSEQTAGNSFKVKMLTPQNGDINFSYLIIGQQTP